MGLLRVKSYRKNNLVYIKNYVTNQLNLQSLPDTFFQNNKRLAHVYLADNQLNEVKHLHFQDKPYLEVVKVGNNNCVENLCAKEVLSINNECSCEAREE